MSSTVNIQDCKSLFITLPWYRRQNPHRLGINKLNITRFSLVFREGTKFMYDIRTVIYIWFTSNGFGRKVTEDGSIKEDTSLTFTDFRRLFWTPVLYRDVNKPFPIRVTHSLFSFCWILRCLAFLNLCKQCRSWVYG